MKTYSATHQGLVRKNNEDRFLIREFENDATLLALADGMGGHAAGEKAAQMAVEALGALDPQSPEILKDLVRVVHIAHENILALSSSDQTVRGMGTTIVAALTRGNLTSWVHVGDSRLYLFRRGMLAQITQDHTIPGHMLARGEISKEAARVHPTRNMLLKCVGCEGCEADTGTFDVEPGDLLLLSTDGLHDAIPEELLVGILSEETAFEERLHALIEAALATGGRDNITLVGGLVT